MNNYHLFKSWYSLYEKIKKQNYTKRCNEEPGKALHYYYRNVYPNE